MKYFNINFTIISTHTKLTLFFKNTNIKKIYKQAFFLNNKIIKLWILYGKV